MTHREINNITYAKALAVLKAHGVTVKITFDTKEIKTKARAILRTEKAKKNFEKY